MRGSFDRTCTVRYGPRSVSGPPSVVYASDQLCRKVVQVPISQLQSPLDLSTHWLTIDNFRLNGPLVNSSWGGQVSTDYLAADQVAFPDFPALWFIVCREELVQPFGRPAYWRYLLIPELSAESPPWPPPGPLPSYPVVSVYEYLVPGPSCANPTMFDRFGDFLLSTQFSGADGFYAFPVSAGESVRITHIGGPTSAVKSDVFKCALHADGCSATFVGQIGVGQLSCASFTWPSGSPAGKMPFSVACDGPPPSTFRTVPVRIENAVC